MAAGRRGDHPGGTDAARAARRVALQGGDILLVRPGWRRKFLVESDASAFTAGGPGLGLDCCEWLHEHEVAAVCSDNWTIGVLPASCPPSGCACTWCSSGTRG
ncbi:cyclase family protein [Pseudonocardia sp. RS010]|uniref:cyclase family protein n=1 Tax=Pseudonocardia sp. RS010 TaxID=3385979 RepID=UPI00399F7015